MRWWGGDAKSQTGFLTFSHHTIILHRSHARKTIMPLFTFLNLRIQNHNPAAILIWLNNRYSLPTRISHLSSTDSIKPFYSNAPGETRTSLHSAFQHTPPPPIPPVTHIKRLVTETFFFTCIWVSMSHSIDLRIQAMLMFSLNIPNSLTQTERQKIQLAYKAWSLQMASSKPMFSCVERALFVRLSLWFPFALTDLPFLFTTQTSLWTRTKGLLVNQNTIKWDFCMLPSAAAAQCARTRVCKCISVLV